MLMSIKNFMLYWVGHEKSFITSGPVLKILQNENTIQLIVFAL